MSLAYPDRPTATALPRDVRIGIVAARFNQDIVDRLIEGCQRRLAELGVSDRQIELMRVPGAFELPVAAARLAGTRRFDAIITLGCVIRGDTPHFDYVCQGATAGIQQVAVHHALPVIFGLLTVNTHEQALARVGGSHGHAGERAADAAAEMVLAFHALT